MTYHLRFVTAATVCLAAVAFLLARPAVAQDAAKVQAVPTAVVHLSHFTDDLHRAFMAVKVASMMQAGGVETTLFLDIEGARLGDARQSLDVHWGSSEMTLAELFKKFTVAGGKVAICPHCAKAAGLDAAHVREGAAIATEGELAQLLISAGKIIDY